jgi:sec-independent protein translocase protein TatA
MGRLFEHPVTLIVLLIIVLLLFGAKRLPDLASGIGQSLRIFKREVNGLHDDEKAAAQPTVVTPPAAPAPTQAAAPSPTEPPATPAPAQPENRPTDPSA